MKKTLLIFLAIVMMAGFTTTVMAQTSATVTATPAGAQLIIPMTLTQVTSLQFGNITKLSAAVGTVTLTTAGVRNVSGSASLSSNAAATTISNATYNVTGNYSHTYALTLPTAITVTEAGAVATMSISALTVKFTGGSEISGVAATSVKLM
jgi:hypothetical protein